MPVGSLERAISARTAGVVRAFGWIEGIRPLLPSRILARGRRSARRTPRSPNAPDPNNVPQPDSYAPPALQDGWGAGRYRMTTWTISGAALALAGASILWLAGPAAAATAISSCSYTIAAPGVYALARDLRCPRPAITVAADGVRLVLGGRTLTSD